MNLLSWSTLSPGEEGFLSSMGSRWSPYEQSRRNSGRKCVRWVQKWGQTSDINYPYLFTVSFGNWSEWGKVASSRVTHELFWNSSSRICVRTLYSAHETCSALSNYASCYRLCWYSKHWQLSTASFCSATSCDRHRWSAASGVSGQNTGKRLENNLTPRKHGPQRQWQHQPHQEIAHCFSLELQVFYCLSLVCPCHTLSLHKIFKCCHNFLQCPAQGIVFLYF